MSSLELLLIELAFALIRFPFVVTDACEAKPCAFTHPWGMQVRTFDGI